jgi:hypothetical protein
MRIVVALLAVAAVLAPAGLSAPEQVVDAYADRPTPWSFVDPCTDEEVAGLGTESGIARVTLLGDKGEHVRVSGDGVVDLFDGDGAFVGTWSYGFHLTDQIPPDRQGAVSGRASGPLRYADGSVAQVTLRFHYVFAKGNTPKHVFDGGTCRS